MQWNARLCHEEAQNAQKINRTISVCGIETLSKAINIVILLATDNAENIRFILKE